MSNYHYTEKNNCNGCFETTSYSNLENVNNDKCDLPCLCRFNFNERSDKDKMYYDWFVLKQPMVLPLDSNIPAPSSAICNK